LGNLSIKQVYQGCLQQSKKSPSLKRPLENFSSRLRWHCHFIQKFESEDRIEFENLNRGYDDLFFLIIINISKLGQKVKQAIRLWMLVCAVW
jgi:hypothetical protein